MKFQSIVPVIISICVIIIVAIIQRYSRTAAGILAVMPVTAPLAIWVIYSANSGDTHAVQDFTLSLVMGILATVAFLVAAWLAARAGWKLVPTLSVGYLTWGVCVILILLVRKWFHL